MILNQTQLLTTKAVTWVISLEDPGIKPNSNGLPGIGLGKNIVGALLTYGFIACVAGLVLAAIAWAVGSHSANSRAAESGKKGVLVALCAALLIGGANVLVGTFSDMGQQL